MKANNFFDFAVMLKDRVSMNINNYIVFKSLCMDIAHLSTYETNKDDYTFYYLYSEYTTIISNDFDNAKLFRNKGFNGVYVIKREKGVYSLIYVGDKLESDN